MTARSIDPFSRVLQLAAYATERKDGFGARDVQANVPGYSGLGLSAFEKAFKRDRESLLSSHGIDIEWSEEEQTYLVRRPYFTPKERAALIAAASVVEVEGIKDEDSLTELGGAVDLDATRIVVEVHGLVVGLRDAIAARQAVQFKYSGRVRSVHPYALGQWGNRWYVMGPEVGDKILKRWRLDRIEDSNDPSSADISSDNPLSEPVELIGSPDAYSIPNDLDAQQHFDLDPNDWGTDPAVTAVINVTRDQVPTFLSEFSGKLVSEDSDNAVISVVVRDYTSFIVRLLGFGTGCKLDEPEELVQRLRDWLTPQAEVI